MSSLPLHEPTFTERVKSRIGADRRILFRSLLEARPILFKILSLNYHAAPPRHGWVHRADPDHGAELGRRTSCRCARIPHSGGHI